MFALALLLGGIFVWFVANYFKHATGEYRRVQGIVASAAGVGVGAPPVSPRSQTWRWVAVLAALPVVVLLLYLFIRRYFPQAPSWAPTAVIWFLGGIVAVLAYRRAHRAPQTKPRRPVVWRALLNYTLWFALIMLAFRFDPRWLPPSIRGSTVLVFLVLLCLVVPALVWSSGFLPLLWIWRALARADYEAALRRADFLLRISPNDAGCLFFRGTVLLFAGRYTEAEQSLRASLETAGVEATYSQSTALANLAEVLMLQERYEEAIRNYEAALQVYVGWGRAYSGLAEVYLWQGTEPERALQLIDRALERKLRSFISRHLDRHILAQAYADRAWALALLGRKEECSAELDKAFRAVRRRFRPGLASVHYRAGRAWLALGERSQAWEHLRRAQELDPGSSGQQASQILRSEVR